MGAWLSNISLKYKFWAVNAVAFVTTLLLVLYAVQLEQQSRSNAAQANARAQAQLLSAWPAGQPLPEASQLLPLAPDQIASVNDAIEALRLDTRAAGMHAAPTMQSLGGQDSSWDVAHAPGAVEPLGSAIKYFRPEFEAGIAQAKPGVPPLARPIVIGA